MAQTIAGRVINPGTANYADSDEKPPALGRQGELITSGYHGDYYQAAKAGRLFHGLSVNAGNAFPLYTTTAFILGLWNCSAEVNLELVSFKCGYVSGTGVAGPFGYNFKDVGLAVGVPLAAFNPVPAAVKPGILGSGFTSKAKFTNAATNTVVAAAVTDYIPSNMSQLVTTAADTSNVPFMMEEKFDGSIILAPGMLFWPAALLASVSLFHMRLTWIEVPVGS